MRPEPMPAHTAAFAEGRRLRDAARRHRREALRDVRREAQRARRTVHRAHRTALRVHRVAGRFHRSRPPVPVVVAAVIGALAVVSIITMLVLAALVGVLAALPVLLAGTVTVAAVKHRRRRSALRRGAAAGPAPAPRPEVAWRSARERFAALRADYAAVECDPVQVLHRPALTDVSVGSTARFIDAFAEAQALETDAFPPAGHAASFVSAVDRAERAWHAAVEAADRIRLSGLSPAERASVERVIKLLTTARDSDSDPERLVAYSRARAELAKLDRAGVIHLPRTAAAALDAAARGALPA
jgi:hypothetical protein